MKSLVYICFVLVGLFLTSCSRNSNQTWEDVKTAGRYMQKSVDTICGKDYESRMLTSDEEFIGPYDGDYIPLSDADLKNMMASSEMALPQPKGVPGQQGIPFLDQYYAPSGSLKNLFQHLHFETDDHVLRDKGELQKLLQIASYLKQNPNVYLVITGHCDERASAGYNMALGMQRAGYIRSCLVKNGVDLNRLYTVSRGKEEPIAQGHMPEDWKLNRRVEFKIYER